jgi:hypothetical protein
MQYKSILDHSVDCTGQSIARKRSAQLFRKIVLSGIHHGKVYLKFNKKWHYFPSLAVRNPL